MAEGDYITKWAMDAGIDCFGITTDGTNIWVVDYFNNDVSKYEMDGTYITKWNLDAANANAHGIATDDTNIWTCDADDKEVYKYAMDGTYVTKWSLNAGNTMPSGITTDGTNIWVCDDSTAGNEVYKYTMDGTYVDNWTPGGGNNANIGLATDGGNIWICNRSQDKVYKYTMTGTYVTVWDLNAGNEEGTGITTDGINFWVCNLQGGDKSVYKYEGPAAPTAAFSGSPLSGVSPLSVTFTDSSAGSPTSWLWEKNDGTGYINFAGTPTAQNPTETFSAGTWDVKLTATNAAGSDSEEKLDYVTVSSKYDYSPVYAKITVDGTAYEDTPKITVDRTIGEFNATSNFVAEFNNFNGQYSAAFNLNDEVIIYADRGTNPPTSKIFCGIIEDIKFSGDVEKEKITLTGRDYGAIMQDMTVQPIIYKNTDAGVIAKQILLNNTEELLTGNNIDITTGTTIERIGFNHVNVFSALQELAELSDYYFYVDTDKDVHFEAKSSTSSSETFDNTNVVNATFKKDDREIYNKVYVYGSRILTGANDVGGIGAGSVLQLSYKPHNVRVSVAGTLQQPAGIYEMTNPATESGLKYLVDFNERDIIFVSGTAAGENVPASGTSNISVDYERPTPLLKYLEDETSITNYGPKTKIIKDENLKSYPEVNEKATKFLADNKDPKIQGDLDIKGLVDITPGNTCIVDLPWHGISSQTYTILSASYTFNKFTNRADKVLHITVNKKLSDFTDVMKEQMIKLKRFEVGPLEGEYTKLLTETRYVDVDRHYELWQNNVNDNFVFHSAKHGKLESPDSRLGTGVLGSTFIASGGGF